MSREAVPRNGPPSEAVSTARGSGVGVTTGELHDEEEAPRQARGPEVADIPAARNISSPVTTPIPVETDGASASPAERESTGSFSVAGIPLPRALTPDEVARHSHARRRRFLRVALVLLSLLLVAETLYLLPLTDPAATQPPRQPSPVPLAEVDPFGVNTFLHKEVDRWKKEKTFQMAHDLGVRWVKQQFPWAEIESRQDPRNPYWDVKNNQSAWTKFDTIVDLAQQNGIRLIARIDSTPAWARTSDTATIDKLVKMKLDPTKAPPLPDKLADFGNFISDFVQRYKGRIDAIQVWNEPNLKAEWATGRPVNPAEYVALLKAAYIAAKKADPNIIVLAAPLATNNESLAYAGNLNELDYLQGMYDAGAKPYFDAMSANAYGKSLPPEDPPSRDVLNFRRVELLHDVMVKNGDDKKAVWFNEYGWNASPDSMPDNQLPWGRVSDQQQADYTTRGIEYAREHWPWAGVFTIWYLRQVGDIPPTASEYYFGLVTPDFVPSPAYRAVQSAAGTYESVAGPGDWGPLSPPVQAGPSWDLHLDASAPGGISLVPTTVGDALDIRFLGTDLKVTLVPSPAAGGAQARYYVTVDGKADDVVPELPRDESGRAYIQVPTGQQPVEVTLVRGLGDQRRTAEHTLEITAASSTGTGQGVVKSGSGLYSAKVQSLGLPGIGMITVETHRAYLVFGILTVLILAAIGLVLLGLRANRRAPVAAAVEGQGA